MTKIEDNCTFEVKADVFLQKADRILSIINNINRQGGITTQLMMAAACIELQSFFYYLENITHPEKEIDIENFLNCSELEKYIRHFKDLQHDLFCDLTEENNPNQQQDELMIISNLKVEISTNERLHKYEHCVDYIDSWSKLQTDNEMLCWMIYDSIRNVVLELESIYYIARERNAESKGETAQ